MSRCLRDEALWLVFEGAGNQRDQAHVEQCEQCSARLRQLRNEVQLLSQVLREAPPVPTKVDVQHAFPWRWVSVVATGATALLLVWSGFLTRDSRSPQSPASDAARQEEIVKVLENEVYDALFTNGELPAVELASRVSTLAYVQAALDGRWPCERRRAPSRTVCDQQPFFLGGEDQ